MTAAVPGRTTALVLSGGIALGAYQAGVFAALEEAGIQFNRLAGVSIGAVNAALIAGNPPGQGAARLREFWAGAANDPAPALSFWGGLPPRGMLRESYNIAGAMQTLMLGRPGLFHPRPLPSGDGRPGLYDLSPLRARLEHLVDFNRLNSGERQLRIAATDVVSGERVVFEAGDGAGIGPDHLLASCAQIPVFAPIEIDGRLLGDGCYSGNTPLDLILDTPDRTREVLCFAVDLFSPQGSRPATLGAAAGRAMDMIFGNQTRTFLDAAVRQATLRAAVSALAERLPGGDPALSLLQEALPPDAPTAVLLLGYRGGLDEAGPVKGFDYTAVTLSDRWQDGAAHARKALRTMAVLPDDAWRPGVTVHEVAA